MGYVNVNGNFLAINEAKVSITNRSFRYGDGLFETIKLINGKPQFFSDHLNRLKEGAGFLDLEFPEEVFTQDMIDQLSKMNGVTASASLRIMLYRRGTGKYVPDTDESSFVMSVEPVAVTGYPLNEHGLTLSVFIKARKAQDSLANFKTNSALVYVLAGIEKNRLAVDDCLVLNTSGRVAEAISSNLFLVKDNVLTTPALSEGPVAGVMRKQIIGLAQQEGLAVNETEVSMDDVLNADEVFLTNATKGVQWVQYLNEVEYVNKLSTTLSDLLDQTLL